MWSKQLSFIFNFVQALVGYKSEKAIEITWGCGGTLISKNYVLTAGHCIFPNRIVWVFSSFILFCVLNKMEWCIWILFIIRGEAKYVLLGDYILDRTDEDAQPLQLNIAQTIKHPQFTNAVKYYDIALLRLERDVEFNQYIRPACLAETFDDASQGKALASGWGQTAFRGRQANVLMKVILEIFTRDECNATYRNEARSSQLNKGIVDAQQFCAGSHNEKKDTCQVWDNIFVDFYDFRSFRILMFFFFFRFSCV